MSNKALLSLALLSGVLSLAGCITIKTQHEIKPIHLTVDVNLKVQRELDNFFADIDAASTTRDYEAAKPTQEQKQ
ncbi:MAG: hypothetical protein SFY80_03960 [Verrucomicrobiota bacterium]|nr:hypothetical protein [Verrucomicrobiota bacterium]